MAKGERKSRWAAFHDVRLTGNAAKGVTILAPKSGSCHLGTVFVTVGHADKVLHVGTTVATNVIVEQDVQPVTTAAWNFVHVISGIGNSFVVLPAEIGSGMAADIRNSWSKDTKALGGDFNRAIARSHAGQYRGRNQG
jgi:hypothetical protein